MCESVLHQLPELHGQSLSWRRSGSGESLGLDSIGAEVLFLSAEFEVVEVVGRRSAGLLQFVSAEFAVHSLHFLLEVDSHSLTLKAVLGV